MNILEILNNSCSQREVIVNLLNVTSQLRKLNLDPRGNGEANSTKLAVPSIHFLSRMCQIVTYLHNFG